MKLKKQIKLGAVSLLEEDNFFFMVRLVHVTIHNLNLHLPMLLARTSYKWNIMIVQDCNNLLIISEIYLTLCICPNVYKRRAVRAVPFIKT